MIVSSLLISLLIWVLIIVVVVMLSRFIIAQFGLGANGSWILGVVGLILLIAFLQSFGVFGRL